MRSLPAMCGLCAAEVADGSDDAVVRTAAAEVAAHALAELVSAELGRRVVEVGGDRARQPALHFGQHADRRADLARRAIPALEAVVLDECSLQRMQAAIRAEPFDRGD